ncbi:MAG: TolC family protein, partial [Chitinophagaceae bacterium]
MFRIFFTAQVLWFLIIPAKAQLLLTEADAITKALVNSKNLQASSLQIKEQEQLLKSAFNLHNPEFFWESPTGNFYTGSITQTIEFPGVYVNQHRLQKQKIGVAQKEKQLTEAEIRYRVKLLYLEAQYAESLSSQLYIQDTLYEKIKVSAIRQFKAGQIDYLQQTFTETQFGEIHNHYLQSLIRAKAVKEQLQWITGVSEVISLTSIQVNNEQKPKTFIPDSAQLNSHPEIQLLQQKKLVARQNIAMQKSKALPGLALGYFN